MSLDMVTDPSSGIAVSGRRVEKDAPGDGEAWSVNLEPQCATLLAPSGKAVATYSSIRASDTWLLPNLTEDRSSFFFPIGGDQFVELAVEELERRALTEFIAQGLVDEIHTKRGRMLLRGLAGLSGGAILLTLGILKMLAAVQGAPGRTGAMAILFGGGVALYGLGQLGWRFQAAKDAKRDPQQLFEIQVQRLEEQQRPERTSQEQTSRDLNVFLLVLVVAIVVTVLGLIAAVIIFG